MLLGGLFSFDPGRAVQTPAGAAEPARHCPDYLFLVPELLLDIDHLARRTSLQAFVHDPAGHDRLAASLRQCADGIPWRRGGGFRVAGGRRTGRQLPGRPGRCELCPPGRAPAGPREGRRRVPDRTVAQLQHAVCGPLAGLSPVVACATPARTASSSMGDFCLFGASPESALKHDAGESRGGTLSHRRHPPARDAMPGAPSMRNWTIAWKRSCLDAKEIAEHIRCWSTWARNDLARVCRSGTRQVRDMLKVDRFTAGDAPGLAWLANWMRMPTCLLEMGPGRCAPMVRAAVAAAVTRIVIAAATVADRPSRQREPR